MRCKSKPLQPSNQATPRSTWTCPKRSSSTEGAISTTSSSGIAWPQLLVVAELYQLKVQIFTKQSRLTSARLKTSSLTSVPTRLQSKVQGGDGWPTTRPQATSSSEPLLTRTDSLTRVPIWCHCSQSTSGSMLTT